MFFKKVRNKSLIIILLITLVSFIHHACGSSEDYDNSSFLNETKSVFKLKLFLAVGEYGTILTSSDGTSWTSQTSGTTQFLYGVTYSE